MENYTLNLPPELQRKILYSAMEHQTARILNDFKKKIKNMADTHYNVDNENKIILEPLDFYTACCSLGYLHEIWDIDKVWFDLLYGWD